MEGFILLVIAFLIAFLVYFIKNSVLTKTATKSKAVKKEEVITMYEKQMKELCLNYSNDTEKLNSEKIKLLKKINHELSMNLFFDENEAKIILQNLAKIG